MQYFLLALFVSIAIGIPVTRKIPEYKFLEELGELSRRYKEFKLKRDVKFAEKYATVKPEERVKLVKSFEESLKAEQEREPSFKPGYEEDLIAVWDTDDGMDKADFKAKLFFQVHDVDGDGYLSRAELKAIAHSRVERLYATVMDTDEEKKEIEKEHTFRYMLTLFDTDGDGRISLQEFKPLDRNDYKSPYHTLIDQMELPDFDNLRNYTALREEVQAELKEHPDDNGLEMLMHYLADKEPIAELPTPTPFKFAHNSDDHAHNQPSSTSPHPSPASATEATTHAPGRS